MMRAEEAAALDKPLSRIPAPFGEFIRPATLRNFGELRLDALAQFTGGVRFAGPPAMSGR